MLLIRAGDKLARRAAGEGSVTVAFVNDCTVGLWKDVGLLLTCPQLLLSWPLLVELMASEVILEVILVLIHEEHFGKLAIALGIVAVALRGVGEILLFEPMRQCLGFSMKEA